jgi:hypothetical protein
MTKHSIGETSPANPNTSPEGFDTWIDALTDDVVQDEYGYEPGEYAVYPEWRAWIHANEGGPKSCQNLNPTP